MAARVCCMTSVWEPPHSRDSNIPRLPHMLGRGSFLHGRLPRLRNNRQASGYARLRCCNQTLHQTPAGPDISLLRPELQQQWHHAKNVHLGDRQITTSSNFLVWWSCDQCPCGLPHEWLATVGQRQNMDYQCPFLQ
ncbi:hypothetical protein WJX82_005709 [Trebouxia sp. C0006]